MGSISLSANRKRAQKYRGKAASVYGCAPRRSIYTKGSFKTAHKHRGHTPIRFSRPIQLAISNLPNSHMKSPFLPAMRTVLSTGYSKRHQMSIAKLQAAINCESAHSKNAVIASQCAHWRGNPPVLPRSPKNGGSVYVGIRKSWGIATPGKRTGSQ